MVSAHDVLAEAEHRGARFRIVGDRLEATPRIGDPVLRSAIGQSKAEIVALVRERDRRSAADAALFPQALLRQGRFAPEPAPGSFHCGHPEECCH